MRYFTMIMIMVMVLCSSPTAWAKVFSGNVVSVDIEKQTVTVTHEVTATSEKMMSDFVITDKTELNGIGSIADLMPGKAVNIDADLNDSTGQWEVKSIEYKEV